MNDPLISCLCCTYGRPVLLGEAVKCFLDQDYNNKELIILNDQEGVNIKCDYNNVKVYNIPKRFNSLGEKRNYIKRLANGEYCCIWDDDDLYTPYRISQSVKFFKENPSYDIIKAKDAIISVDNLNYKKANNLFHSQAIIKKEYIDKTEYPSISVAEDIEFEKNAKIKSVDIFPRFWYVYRWGLNTHHVSGLSNEKESWKRSIEFYKNMKGDFVISPEFKNNYWEEINKHIKGKLCH